MFKIICVGSIKEKYLIDAINEYKKRISKYTKLEIVQIADSKIEEKALNEERDLILKNIDNKDLIIAMDIEGKMLTSPELSEMISNSMINHVGKITFIIGGSLGLHSDILKIANYRLSFSKLTFPHQLFRVILLEQIYRSFKIINNETYHK